MSNDRISRKDNVLNIAVKYNYWKPYQFLFRYFQLKEYDNFAKNLQAPFLEIGSGDGTFSKMMLELGIISDKHFLTDYNINALKIAKCFLSGNYIRINATKLPFKERSVSTVFSNSVLCCLFRKLDEDVISVINEAYKVLKDSGNFIISVATNYFNENLSTYKFLRKLGLNSLAKRYIKKFEKRLTHFNVYSEDKWKKLLEDNGFIIERVGYFFTPQQGFWYGLLSLRLFQVLSIFKKIKLKIISRFFSSILKKIFNNHITNENRIKNEDKKQNAGYILIFSHKQ